MTRKTVAAITAGAVSLAAALVVLTVMFTHQQDRSPIATQPAAATSSAAADNSCQIAMAAYSRASAIIAGATIANSAATFSKAGSIYSLASQQASDSEVRSDLALAAVHADRMAADIRLGMGSDLKREGNALIAAEMKITGKCQ